MGPFEDEVDGAVVVLTALNLEYRAVREHLVGLRRATHRRGGTGFEIGYLPGVGLPVALLRTGEGNVVAGVLAERAIEAFDPAAVLFVGVAGGLKDDIALGDVVVATRVYAVHGAKEQDGRSLARPRAFEAGHELLDLAQHLDATRTWQAGGAADAVFRVHFKPVASGEVVLNSRRTPLARQLYEHYNDAAAIEMESAGVAQAAHVNQGLPMLTVRGISDKADGRKHAADEAGGQVEAAARAAQVAFAVLREYAAGRPTRPGPPSGRRDRWLAVPAVVYDSLPADTAAFTGRAEEIAAVLARAADAADRGALVQINAFDGMPGVGKTALAVHLAHALADRFPQRRLFVDLHGHSPDTSAADPAAVLAALLTGDGIEARDLPADLDARAALWRARTAGRRMLLVLDNAASSAQVAPLLPGAGACLVLVTSRRHLGDLPHAVEQITLQVLPFAEAVALFVLLAPRAAGEKRAVDELVQLAGRLPLALALYAAVYRGHEAWTVANLVDHARTAGLTLAAEHRTVQAAFDLSYRGLSPDRRAFFRLLGLHPGVDLDADAAAALTGISPAAAQTYLEALHGDRLLTEPAYRRYGMHDLIRSYAHAQAEAEVRDEQRDSAITRLLRYYAARPRLVVGGYDTPQERALPWLRTERENLLACIEYAYRAGRSADAVRLSRAVAFLLSTDGPWGEASAVHERAAQAARDSGDRSGQAHALSDLASVRLATGEYAAAQQAFTTALQLCRELGDRSGQAGALDGLGRVYRAIDEYAPAREAHTAALQLCRELGDRSGQANVLNGLGRLHGAIGEGTAAREAHTAALELYRELGDRSGQADALNDLGSMRLATKEYAAAEEALTAALELFRELGNRRGEAYALDVLGLVRLETGEHAAAEQSVTAALALFRQLGHRSGQGYALTYLGSVRRATRQFAAAEEALTAAVALFRQLGDRLGQAYALDVLGLVRLETEAYAAAEQALTAALELYRQLGNRRGQADALKSLDKVSQAAGSPPGAQEFSRGSTADPEQDHPE